MKFTIIVASSILLCTINTVSAVPITDGVLVFTDGAPVVSANTFILDTGVYVGGRFISTAATNNTNFGNNTNGAPAEFRMISPVGRIGGGGEKSLVGTRDDGTTADNGLQTITWVTRGGQLDSSDGDLSPGAYDSSLGTTQGLMTNSTFFGEDYGFALNPMSPLFIDADFGTDTLSVTTYSLEVQWGNSFFPMGLCDGSGANEVNTDGQGCGIRFEGDITNVGVDGSFDFTLFGESRFTPWEDTQGGTATYAAGFSGWVAQFALQGTYTPTATVPAPSVLWLLGAGLIGFTGFGRRNV